MQSHVPKPKLQLADAVEIVPIRREVKGRRQNGAAPVEQL
jgi:hypothetical protein